MEPEYVYVIPELNCMAFVDAKGAYTFVQRVYATTGMMFTLKKITREEFNKQENDYSRFEKTVEKIEKEKKEFNKN